MKKLALTIAIVLGMTIGAFAQGGLFGKGVTRDNTREDDGLLIPSVPGEHGLSGDQNAAPVGSGIALLIGFGAAYAAAKRRK
jgi:hypothetical protein